MAKLVLQRRGEARSKRKPKGSGGERRQEILAAARDLFAREGYARVTTRALAEKAGLSQTGLYIYFATKEDILRAISDETHDALAAAFDRAAEGEGTPQTRLRRLLRAYIDFGLDHPADYQLTFTVGPDALAPLAKDFSRPAGQQENAGARSILRFRDHLAAFEAHAQLGGRDPLEVTQMLWMVGHGAVSLLITRNHFPWGDRDALVEDLVTVMLNGLASPPRLERSRS